MLTGRIAHPPPPAPLTEWFIVHIVRLRVADAPLAEACQRVAEGVVGGPDGPQLAGCLGAAAELGTLLPVPATGRTAELWEALATLGAADLTLARVAEPHLDALAILTEAGQSPPAAGARYGVYASEAPGGPVANLRAHRDAEDAGWSLTGEKAWCSLAGHLPRALVTAWTGEDERGLFDVDLRQGGVSTSPPTGATWAARGLAQVTSTSVRFDAVPASPVGPPEWYLQRRGFAWGGVGVAAIWFGAAAALARTLRRGALARTPDQVALLHLGAVDSALHRARSVLLETATMADMATETTLGRAAVALCAARARQVVADTVEEVLTRVGRATGPGPLTQDEEHARRVADLTVYVRQHHAERDQARLGTLVLEATSVRAPGWSWW